MEEYLNKVIHGDCLSVMKKLPDNCIDLVLTDPPYGIGESRKDNASRGKQRGGLKNNALGCSRDYPKKEWDNKIPTKEMSDEIKRISKHQIIWGGNYFVEYLENSPCWIVWDKDNGKNDFADCELAWTNYKTAVRKFKWRWHGMLQEDMKNKDIRQHPTQKPVELMVWCLENYLMKKWDKDRRPIVFDGFAGSGTTAVACKKCGCDYILVEKEKDYCDIIHKRLAQETLF